MNESKAEARPVEAPNCHPERTCKSPYHRPTSLYCLDCLPSDAPLGALLLSNRKPTADDVKRGQEIAELLKQRGPVEAPTREQFEKAATGSDFETWWAANGKYIYASDKSTYKACWRAAQKATVGPVEAPLNKQLLNEAIKMIGMLRSFIACGESTTKDDDAAIASILDKLRIAGVQPLPVVSPPRTDKDYAIEHGGYLADAAEAYIDERNKYDALDQVDVAEQDLLNDHFRALNSAIYEFRKRAKRAVSPPPAWSQIQLGMPLEQQNYLDDIAHGLVTKEALAWVCELVNKASGGAVSSEPSVGQEE